MFAAQIFAVIIFIGMFVMIVLDKIERHYVTLGSGLLTLVVVFGICMRSGTAISDTLAFKGFFTKDFWYQVTESESKGINWSTILFIAGMMVMVEGMAKAGFFRWLCMKIAYMVKCKTVPIFITFMIMSAVLSMFIDNERRERRERLEDTIEVLRSRFGKKAVTYAILLGDLKMPGDGRDKVKMPGMMYT